MTTREFDPVFSAALRNELEALADRADQAAPVAVRRPALLRPQLWISLATAVVLLAATIGVLHLTHADVQPAQPGPTVVDPLSRITDPSSAYYVARSVNVLLDARGIGGGTDSFSAPAGLRGMQVYLNCSKSVRYAVELDHKGFSAGDGCDADSGSNASAVVRPGTHSVTVDVRAGVRWSLLIIETPAPTVSTGALIDPLTQVRDLRNPDAIVGDTQPLLQLRGEDRLVMMPAQVAVPKGVGRLRVFLACRPTSAATRVRIDGHVVSGCQNAVAHWFDFTPSARTITAQVAASGSGEWALLVVPAPKGAKDSPANTLLPYPDAGVGLLARARGVGAQETGTFVASSTSILLTVTCRGTGWLEEQTPDGSTSTRGNACSTKRPSVVGFVGQGDDIGKRQRWTVIPHGDISWTFQLTTDD